MPPRRELEEQNRRSRKRVAGQRDGQVSSQGRGEDQFRGGGNLGGGLTEDNPLNVRVVEGRESFYGQLVRAFRDADRKTNEHGANGREQMENVVIKDLRAVGQAANQIAAEMRASVQMLKDQRSGLDTSLDGLQDAIDDFVNQQQGRVTTTSSGGSAVNPPPPMPPPPTPPQGGPGGTNTPQTPAGSQGGSGGQQRPIRNPYADQMRRVDPGDRLGGDIFGGQANYWDMMARGDNPDQAAMPGRNHPGSAREVRAYTGAKIGRFIHQRYGLGSSSVPKLTPQTNDEGDLTHYDFDDGTGAGMQQIAPSNTSALSAASHAVSAAMVGKRLMASKVGSAMAQGMASGGVKSGLMGAGRAIPAVGVPLAAIQVGNEVSEYATEQRRQNQFYQQIYGGSNMSGFMDRLGEEAAVYGQRFGWGMDEETTRQAYRGISQLGYDGDKRDQYMGFVSDNYKKTGMSADQSMGVLTAATRNANEGLIGVAKSLESVTKRARGMGVNVGKMTDEFVKNYSMLAETGMGTGSGPLAAALTNQSVGLGRGMEGSSWAGAFTPSNMRILGGQSGQSLNQFLVQSRENPVASGAALDKRVNQTLGGVLDRGGWRQRVQAEIAKRGGQEAIKRNPNLLREIWHQMQSDPDAPDPEVLQQLIQSAGGEVTDLDDAGVQAVSQVADPSRFEHEAAEAKEKVKPRDLTEDERRRHDENPQRERGRYGEDRSGWSPLGDFADMITGAFGEETASDAAWQIEGDSGKKNPVFDSLVSKYGSRGDVGVEVQTKDGPKTVTMAEAMRNYGDQVSRGTATLVGGPNDGQQIKDVEGIEVDSSAQGDSSGREEGGGTDREGWKGDHPAEEDAGEGGGEVKLDLTDEAKRLVKQLDPAGDSDTETSASVGGTPNPGAREPIP